MAMPERGYAADRLDPSLANYALTLSEGFAGGGLIEDAANSFTVEFWVKPVTEHEIDLETNTGYGGTANQKFVIFPAHGGAAETGKAGMGVSVGTNGVSVYEHAGGYMPAILVWASPTPLTAWTHVAVVYNNKLPSLYINGVLVHTAGAASTKDYVYPCYQFPGGYYGTQTGGQMDEVRIWGVARTQAQIAANMNTEVAANSANLLGYWPMNEGTGTMLTDVTGNGRNIDLTAFGAGYSSNGSWTSTGTAAIAAKAAYRYGFNGQEHSTEIGDDSYTAEFWEYDSRAGRRWNIDPRPNVSLSNYSTFANNPIWYSDKNGDTLSVSRDLNTTNDIKSVVQKRFEAFIYVNDNNEVLLKASIKIDGKDVLLRQAASQDNGISTLNDIINSKKNIFYSATNSRNYDVLNSVTGELRGSIKNDNSLLDQYPAGTIVDQNTPAVGNPTGRAFYVTFSNNSFTPRGDEDDPGALNGSQIVPNKITKFLTHKRKYDGTVSISPGNYTQVINNGGVPVIRQIRSKVVLHELTENFLRVNGANYVDAHNKAIQLNLGVLIVTPQAGRESGTSIDFIKFPLDRVSFTFN